jgi:hypothetical protein
VEGVLKIVGAGDDWGEALVVLLQGLSGHRIEGDPQ